MSESYDLLIRGGDLIDGTGAPARRGDVAIRDGRVAALGEVKGSAGAGRSNGVDIRSG